MKNFIDVELVPMEERLDSINVDSVLQETLTESGIDLAYAYAVYSAPSDSARIISDEQYRDDLADSDFRVRLFPEDVFAQPAYLSVFFPDHRMFIWGQISPMLGATVLFTLLIVGSFGYSIRALNRQKRVSELMVDFINNMTHEFKTPIATVALAAEAIGREEVVSDPKKIRRFNEMIVSETGRMRGQAERILQMAALEERTLELAPVIVDLHEILDDAIRAIELRVADENGAIVREFKATNPKLEADKVHLLNIAHNLLDNANKYSDGAPHITISTFDSDRGVGFRIVDRGIGIEAQDQKQVFEKYFRASTGNVHNVKGFGLGLSYVKLIVDQHDGEITLHSIPGEKTEVEIILPHSQSKESAS
jgi:signal transduction histidine kinase